MKKLILLFVLVTCLISVFACTLNDDTSIQDSNSSTENSSSIESRSLESISSEESSSISDLEKGADIVLSAFDALKTEVNNSSAPASLKNELIDYIDNAIEKVDQCKTLSEMLNLSSNTQNYVLVRLQNYLQ